MRVRGWIVATLVGGAGLAAAGEDGADATWTRPGAQTSGTAGVAARLDTLKAAWERNDYPGLRAEIEALSAYPLGAVLPTLASCLAHPVLEVSLAAAETLARVGGALPVTERKPVLDALVPFLSVPQEQAALSQRVAEILNTLANAPPAPVVPAGERWLADRRAASIACVAELSRVRVARGLPPLVHDERLFVACTEAAREMAKSGGFGVGRVKRKPTQRASAHGWGIGIYDNYTGSYKSIFDPADVVARLGSCPAKGSMFAKGGVNVGAFGIWDADAEQVYIVMGLAKEAQDEAIVAAQRAVAGAREALASARGGERVGPVQRIADLRQPEAGPFLAVVAAGDPDPDARRVAVRGLVALGDGAVVEPLIAALAAGEGEVRAEARAALEAVTGHRLGDAPAAWTKWWDRARDTWKRH